MKITGLILAFYLILLAAIPCCIIDNCTDDKTEQASRHESGDKDCGNCSPFFSCVGCAPATIFYQPVQFELSLLKQKPAYTAYLQTSLPKTVNDFWQPPKLVNEFFLPYSLI